jgi:alpha-tubulin suppressor-like RCC1 family protein
LINFRKPQKLECKAIIQITAGDNHLLALDDEGAIFGIGSNEFGQLGMRPSDGLFHQQTKELTKIESACFISANQNLSLAITLEGELLYMGELTELSNFIDR